ncbi:MAG: serine protein kinase RIO [Candidatus Thorarchaeota archaeon]
MIDAEIERRMSKRLKDQDELKVVEGVLDPITLKELYRLSNKGLFKALHGVVSSGKEANVYRGETEDGKSVAVKVYRVATAQREYMLEYLLGDPRYTRVPRQSKTIVPIWAMKEFRNLKLYSDAGIRVPKPIEVERNVLVMEFIGDAVNGVAAPLLRHVHLEEPELVYEQILRFLIDAYRKAGLVHADLSEYNIMWYGGPVFIDVAQAVLRSHNNALQYLFRDIKNITNYFRKLGVETEEPTEILDMIVNPGETSDVDPRDNTSS